MEKTSNELVLEVRSILYILHSLTEGSKDWDEDVPWQEIVHLLSLAKTRMDTLSSIDQSQR